MTGGAGDVRETYELLKRYDDEINFDPVSREYVYPQLPTFVAALADHLGETHEVDSVDVDRDDRRAGRQLAVEYLDGGDLPTFAADARDEIESLRQAYVKDPEHCPYCGSELVDDLCQSHDCPCPTFPDALDAGASETPSGAVDTDTETGANLERDSAGERDRESDSDTDPDMRAE
ncbi:hypothetical protein [Halospeciosus flavus]|uniref:Uncharacterized protein n=1 Tax=Halospeciosus flavus TaxID=3032283 RepID=A0ABD5Z2M9_9EURY|nr:hypothetical protein [Halospeciosus flavus]